MADYFADAVADDPRLARSKIMLNIASGTHNVVRIPTNAFIMGVWLWVKVAYGTTSTIDIGFNGNGETADPDAFIDNTSIDITRVGMYSAMRDPLALNAAGKYFTGGSGMATLTLVKGNAAATASCQVYVSYNELF